MKKRILVSFGTMAILILIMILPNIGEKGSFEEIILSEYQENNFHDISIEKRSSDGEFIIKKSEETEDIDEFLSLFEGLEIKEVEHGDYGGEKYAIHLSNDNTHESLFIHVMDGKYLYIDVNTVEKEEDKENNVTKYVPGGKYGDYKIIDGELDIEVIEEIFNRMEINE